MVKAKKQDKDEYNALLKLYSKVAKLQNIKVKNLKKKHLREEMKIFDKRVREALFTKEELELLK